MFCIFFKKFLFLKILNHNNTIHRHTFSRLSLVYVNIMNVFSFPPFCQFTNYLRDPLNLPLTHAAGVGGKLWRFTKDSTTIFFHFLRFLPHKQTCTSEIWKSRFDSLMKGKNRKLIEKEKRKRIRNIFFFLYIFFQLDKVNSNWGQQQKIQLFFVLIIFALNNLCGILLGDEKQF